MRALVTGGAGFIGSNLVDRLLAEGHSVDVVDNLATGSLKNLADARRSAGHNLTIHNLDIRAPELVALAERQRPDVRVPLAAQSTCACRSPDPMLDADGRMPSEAVNVLEAARAAGSRKVVYASSGGTIYGSRRPTRPPGQGEPSAGPAVALRGLEEGRPRLPHRLSRAPPARVHLPCPRERVRPASGPSRRGGSRVDLRGAPAVRAAVHDLRHR